MPICKDSEIHNRKKTGIRMIYKDLVAFNFPHDTPEYKILYTGLPLAISPKPDNPFLQHHSEQTNSELRLICTLEREVVSKNVGHFYTRHIVNDQKTLITTDGLKNPPTKTGSLEKKQKISSKNTYLAFYSVEKKEPTNITQTVGEKLETITTKEKNEGTNDNPPTKPSNSGLTIGNQPNRANNCPNQENPRDKGTPGEQNKLKVLFNNIRSYKKNLPCLIRATQERNPDIVCLAETWLKSEDKIHTGSNHQIFTKCRDDRTGGGLLTMIKAHIQAFEEPELTTDYTLTTRLVLNPRNHLYVINFYAPPDKKTEALITLSEKHRKIDTKYSQIQILVAGDFNILPSNNLITNLKNTI